MIEEKSPVHKYRNKPNRMNDAGIMVIFILFHLGGFCCFKHYYGQYVCKYLTHLFPKRVSYTWLELEKEIFLSLAILIE